MDSMPLILARLTVSGLVIIDFLLLWLLIKQCSNGAQRRRTRRQPIVLPAEVSRNKGVKLLTNDLSLEGCRIHGDLAVRLGQHLPLRLHLPGRESPIVVERAAVRWVGENDFGLQFMALPSSERARLGELLQWVA